MHAPADPVISVRNVTKTIGARDILRDVSFSLERASLTALIGPNGAGKTSLVRILLGLDAAHTGQVSVGANERVQYVPQLAARDAAALPVSVAEFLRVGMSRWFLGRRAAATDIAATLTHVGLSREVQHQSVQSLSGGEQQRLAIARSLLAEPSVLVLDEPLASVDYHARHALYELIRHLQQAHGMTVLLVSHDIDSVLPISDRVLCLNQTLHENCHPCDLPVGNHGELRHTVHHTC